MKTINELNHAIAKKTEELKNLSTASGHYGTAINERAELIRQRDELLHRPAVDKKKKTG
jgi:hypothetical protein